MRKIIVILTLFCLMLNLSGCIFKKQNKIIDTPIVDTVHNSKNSLEWWGVYEGTIPCADCPGIKVKLALNRNKTYEIVYDYIGETNSEMSDKGAFTWDETGGKIVLENLKKQEFPYMYIVGENIVIQLDMDGNLITGALANNYILKRIMK